MGGSSPATGAPTRLANANLTQKTGFYVPLDWGTYWRPKLAAAQAGTGFARAVVLGDSIGRGYYASNLETTSWASLLKAALQGSNGSAGDGGSGMRTIWDTSTQATAVSVNGTAITAYEANGSLIVPAGTWSSQSQNGGPAGNYAIKTVDASTPGSITFTGRGTTVDIYAYGGAGANAAWTYSIDGGSAVPVTDGGSAAPYVTTVTGLAAGSHTVKLTYNDAGTKGFFPLAVRFYNSTGVALDNCSLFAQQSTVWASANTARINYAAGYHAPADLLICAMAVNDDHVGDVAADTWLQNVTYAIQAAKDYNGTAQTTVTGATDVIILMNHLGQDDTNNLYGQYVQRARGLAESQGAALVDLWSIGRNSWNYWNGLNYWANESSPGAAGTSAVHPSDAGHAFIKSVLAPLFLATA